MIFKNNQPLLHVCLDLIMNFVFSFKKQQTSANREEINIDHNRELECSSTYLFSPKFQQL